MLFISFFIACQTEKELDIDPSPTEFEIPSIWGFDALEDSNPDPNIVEVYLEASAINKEIGGEVVPNVWAYNGLTPGPLLQAKQGDQVIVHFTNNLDTATTIHWHGLRIPDDMDGTPAVQDPIEPGDVFTYDFIVPDSGTYWYHPHMRSPEAVERGLQAPLIIHNPDDPMVEQERMFVIDDLYLTSSGTMGSFEMNHPNSVHGRHGNNLLTNGVDVLDSPLTDTMRPGASERWRIVNSANARTMWIDVEGAAWQVIAIDGTTLDEPYRTDRVELPVGRRFDLEVIADDSYSEVALNVLMPAQAGQFDTYPVFLAPIEGEAGPNSWKDWTADPLPNTSAEIEQEVELHFNVSMGSDGLATWTINGEVFGEHEPIVVQGDTPSYLRIINHSAAEHPYHLHGDFFQVLSRSTGELLPGQMDTILVEPDEELVLWTNFSNPGRWMSHCHILEHSEQGMMSEIIVE